jgi:DNA-binding protein H-NS
MARKRTTHTTRTIQDIDAEIAHLQRERDQIRDADKAGVIAHMKEAIGYYAITAAELGLTAREGKSGAAVTQAATRKATRKATPTAKATKAARTAKATPAPKTKRAVGRVKFKDDAGHTWSGFGPRPKWFVEALASGKTEDELRAA